MGYIKKMFINEHDFPIIPYRKYIFTIGCFDKLHFAHERLLNYLAQNCEKLVVGLRSDACVTKRKNITDIQPATTRKSNIMIYASHVYIIDQLDPTNETNAFINEWLPDVDRTTAMFVRGDDCIEFPGRDYISSIMDIQFIKYTESISSTFLRSNYKSAILNRVLIKLKNIFHIYQIGFFLDKSTLEACITYGTISDNLEIGIDRSNWTIVKNINWNQELMEEVTINIRDDSIMIKSHENDCSYIFNSKTLPELHLTLLNGELYPVPTLTLK